MSRNRIIIALLIVAALVFSGFLWWNYIGRRTVPPPSASIAENLDIPWEMVFLPDKSILLTERPGTVRFIDSNRNLQNQPIFTITDVAAIGEGGLLGATLHPQFAINGWVYFYYTYQSGTGLANRVVRYTLHGTTFSDRTVIIEGIPGGNIHDGGRIKFGPDGLLYICVGETGNENLAQDLNSLAGKILRLTDDGTIPASNPFPDSAIYSYGHRNPEGLVWDDQGRLWETEHGASAQDEINLIEPGKNYGWPVIRGDQTAPGMTSPVLASGNVTWAPSGLTIVAGSIYFAGLESQSLFKYDISTGKLTRYLNGSFGRLRDVVAGPDDLLYILTNNRDGRGIPLTGDDRVIRIDRTGLVEST
ncbi:Glucose/arabinose dehydrogenase, beta-propeller fold [Dehalogenimonas formicexedens]|uniref:Glucose/arabinose dehydrogenase, beta-propeller fold n=1 Tax=Dehalogenimonas formicexedens TaxID=1839801 RepID=A0A1P8F636_9CHLR|nr:PQQ-dependent sugar dehydrogenase [Dehalogenimonas formicexedens]APV43944.1 Glucose/arabinose dehydrogenase, beta-propeller fold [Dehalogenimonas formicexedens]